MVTEYLNVMFSLALVILLFFVCVYLLKKAKGFRPQDSKQLRIVKAISMGSKEKLVIVELDEAKLLLGVTPNHIETLYIFGEQQASTREVKVGGQPTFKEEMLSLNE